MFVRMLPGYSPLGLLLKRSKNEDIIMVKVVA
jgi:hypothetical protein